jgi:hypothetical protein
MFLLSRWEQAVWSAIEIASSGSVGVVCKLEWVHGVWDDGVDMSHDQPFKSFHCYICECYGAIVIYTGYPSVLGQV